MKIHTGQLMLLAPVCHIKRNASKFESSARGGVAPHRNAKNKKDACEISNHPRRAPPPASKTSSFRFPTECQRGSLGPRGSLSLVRHPSSQLQLETSSRTKPFLDSRTSKDAPRRCSSDADADGICPRYAGAPFRGISKSSKRYALSDAVRDRSTAS